ncbi:unnamed protein product, partial [Brassica rapa]
SSDVRLLLRLWKSTATSSATLLLRRKQSTVGSSTSSPYAVPYDAPKPPSHPRHRLLHPTAHWLLLLLRKQIVGLHVKISEDGKAERSKKENNETLNQLKHKTQSLVKWSPRVSA